MFFALLLLSQVAEAQSNPPPGYQPPLFRSVEDHVVEPSNSAYILATISSTDVEEVLLPDSFHVATLDYDAEVIHRDSIAFVRRLTG